MQQYVIAVLLDIARWLVLDIQESQEGVSSFIYYYLFCFSGRAEFVGFSAQCQHNLASPRCYAPQFEEAPFAVLFQATKSLGLGLQDGQC